MASIAVNVVSGIISFTNLVICSDILHEYNTSSSESKYPSGEVKNAIVFALVTSIWGMALAIVVPIVHRSAKVHAAKDTAGTSLLLLSALIFGISAAVLTRASRHGGACIDKRSTTCHLFTAVLGLEWTMTGLALLGMTLSSMYLTAGRWSNEPQMTSIQRV